MSYPSKSSVRALKSDNRYMDFFSEKKNHELVKLQQSTNGPVRFDLDPYPPSNPTSFPSNNSESAFSGSKADNSWGDPVQLPVTFW